jgi:hypothetical protein
MLPRQSIHGDIQRLRQDPQDMMSDFAAFSNSAVITDDAANRRIPTHSLHHY